MNTANAFCDNYGSDYVITVSIDNIISLMEKSQSTRLRLFLLLRTAKKLIELIKNNIWIPTMPQYSMLKDSTLICTLVLIIIILLVWIANLMLMKTLKPIKTLELNSEEFSVVNPMYMSESIKRIGSLQHILDTTKLDDDCCFEEEFFAHGNPMYDNITDVDNVSIYTSDETKEGIYDWNNSGWSSLSSGDTSPITTGTISPQPIRQPSFLRKSFKLSDSNFNNSLELR